MVKYEVLPTCDCEICDGDAESDSGEATGSEDSCVMRKPAWLPNWLYTSSWGVPCEVKTIMKSKMENPDQKLGDYGGNLTMFDVSGPAVAWLWVATAIHWPFMLAFPFAAFQFTECNGLGLPCYHYKLWCLVIPVLVIIMAIEWRCFTYTITPVVQGLGKVESPVFDSFHLWLATQVGLSIVASTDVVTQGLFLSSTCRWFTCPGWDDVAASWVEVWNDSLFSWITAGRDLQTILIITWGLALVQLPLFILAALPVQFFAGESINFDLRSEKHGYHVCACWPSLEDSSQGAKDDCPRIHCTWSRIWHADALKTLATLNRMSYVNAGLFFLQLKRAEIARSSGDAERSCQILKMELRQMIPRIFLINLCQNCMKLEVQCTIFSLGRMVSNTTNWQCFFSIVVAQLTSSYDLYVFVLRANKIRKAVRDARAHSREMSRSSNDDNRVAAGKSEVSEHSVKQIHCLIIFVALAGALCAFVQLHSMAKLIGAFVCEDAIWNFPNRCADVRKY